MPDDGQAGVRNAGQSAAEQGEVAAFLGDPATHGGAAVERFETHAALVFVAGERAYKIKRAVRYPYLDFSTLDLRRTACEKEVALNRRTAPALYLGVEPIVRAADGGLRVGGAAGEGESVVEWVIIMRAFAQSGLFDRLAQEGALTPELLTELVDEIRAFHGKAEPVARGGVARGGGAGMQATVSENDEDIATRPDLFAADAARRLSDASAAAVRTLTPLLEDRWDRGLVRRCHGDLHLRNICLVEGRPTLFDAIEFNDAIACIDVVYDLAFLLMDLDHRGLRAEANLVLNRYFQDSEDLAVLAALPLFLSVRAAVRAKVAATAESTQRDAGQREALRAEARDYFAAAQAYLAPPEARLVAVGGFSGSGKSTLARRIAPALGAAPGAVILRSDTARKALFGVDELSPLPEKAYRPKVSAKVYRSLLERARTALAAGHSVVLDAVYAEPAARSEAEAIAREAGVAFAGFWLEGQVGLLARRTAARQGDASDATPEVVRRQAGSDLGRMTWHRLDAARAPDDVAAAAVRQLDIDP